ncbi:hypothetical protein OESDEN_20584 [Oesophagostomum dentatum]|uniref:Uncharacterized protein n=1 Tax=Oesophagostomum dentatum TaxID=61180 RepID=A0A0B1S497_OESDE|nr:hypothetical protein OESDEN_20584 [Oesophagostomum dentatum]
MQFLSVKTVYEQFAKKWPQNKLLMWRNLRQLRKAL